MEKRRVLVDYLDQCLRIHDFTDESANGLQVQGSEDVTRIGVATDAALRVYERATELGCDMLVVHHGIIWGGGIPSVTGRYYAHIKYLMDNNINLYAAHLPLDAHGELGNNAELARLIGLNNRIPFGRYHGMNLGFSGTLERPISLESFTEIWQNTIASTPYVLPFGPGLIEKVAIVSGGGSSSLQEAIDAGMDCLVTGEGKHQDHHLAAESGIHVVYLGHYASETVGVRAIGRDLLSKYDVDVVFIDEPTRF